MSSSFPFEQSRLKLGAGGSGAVFLGRSAMDHNHLVAIKRRFVKMNSYQCPESVCPEDEAEHAVMTRCCTHPNTMGILASVTQKDVTHFAMDLMRSDLSHEMKRGAKFSTHQTCFILHELLQAIAHLHHSCGLIHRDVKPSNILLDPTSANPAGVRVVLGDYGVAHYTTDIARPAVNFRGTRIFHAPEVLFGRVKIETSSAIDMWAVGCTFYSLLSGGRPPFVGDVALELLSKVIECLGSDFQQYPKQVKPSRLFDHLPNVPPSAADLLTKLLCLDPTQRISAAQALQHPFFAEFGAIDAPIHLIGYENFNPTKFTFKPISADTNTASAQADDSSRVGNMDSFNHDENSFMRHNTSHNTSNNSSIHLSQQRPNMSAGHLTLSNLRTNALFNSSGTSQQKFSTSRALFGGGGSPQPSANGNTVTKQLGFGSPTPARRTLTFDSPMRPIDLNCAHIED